uniref:Uncharacterized protein n=1 Tax=Arundo donax TaxID=35708 RepID=A0A0A9A0P5_ARUDO
MKCQVTSSTTKTAMCFMPRLL